MLNSTVRTIAFVFLVTAAWHQASASDLTEVLPLTDRILVLHFDDGKVLYHGYHQTDSSDKAIQSKLAVDEAVRGSSYLISSSDDPAYSADISPVRVGRKSKGKAFSRNCKWDGQRCNNDYVLEHWIYLELPDPLLRGKSYTLKTGILAANGKEWHLTYDEFALRSPALHVNQVGYAPTAGMKFGYVSHWMGDLGPLSLDRFAGAAFHIVRAGTDVKLFSGTMTKQKDLAGGGPDTGQPNQSQGDNFVGAEVWQCDFSEFKTPGVYRLVVEGIGSSYPFRIGRDVYRQAFYATARGLYHERSGIDLVERYTRWPRKADHRQGSVPGFTLKYTSYRFMDSPSESGPESEVRAKIVESVDTTNMWGWYHDAGDWDAYPSHAEVPAYLLTAYELAPGNFSDGELNLPESGNGIPDILDEASWLPAFYRRAKGPTGGIAGARVHGDFAPEPQGIPSYEDTRQWIIFGEEPVMSFKYAALAAQLSHCFRAAAERKALGSKVQAADLIGGWRTEAIAAYRWAIVHTLSGDNVREARAYAAAWLFKLTAENSYQVQFLADNPVTSADISKFADYRWAIWAYVTTGDATAGLNKTAKSDLILAAKKYAQQEVTDAIDRNRSFRAGGNWFMPVVAGQPTTPWILPAIIAYETTGETRFLDAAYTTCDYMLGGNPLDMTWITGLGSRYPTQILQLDWWYGGNPEILPGIVPYGPVHKCDWMSGPGGICDYSGPWDADFSATTAYPSSDTWPIHELFFENRYCPPTNEFTIHQNIAPAAAAFGYLSSPRNSAILFPHVAVGGGFSTEFTFLNTGADASTTTLAAYLAPQDPALRDGQAAPAWRAAGGRQEAVSSAVVIPSGGTRAVSATPQDGGSVTSTGWASLDSSGGQVWGFATFRLIVNGKLKTVAGVLGSSPVQNATIPVDDDVDQDRYTGYAVANPGTESTTIRIVLVNENGQTVSTLQPVTLAPEEQKAAFVFEDRNAFRKFRGSAVLMSQDGRTFAVVALVQNRGLYTAIPAVPTKPPNVN